MKNRAGATLIAQQRAGPIIRRECNRDDVGETIAGHQPQNSNDGNPTPLTFSTHYSTSSNRAGRLTVTDSLFCGQLIGHDIQSLALVTRIENNRQGPMAKAARRSRHGLPRRFEQLAHPHTRGRRRRESRETTSFRVRRPKTTKWSRTAKRVCPSATTAYRCRTTFLSTAPPNATGIYDPKCVPVQLSNNAFQGIATPVDPSGCAVYR